MAAPREFLRKLEVAVAKAATETGPLDAWAQLALDRTDPAAEVDQDDAFLDYRSWHRALGLGRSAALPYAKFARELGRLGLQAARPISGRVTHTGARLARWRLAPEPEVLRRAEDVRRFVGERCLVAPGARIGAAELYDAYTAWVASAGADRASIKGFRAAMLAAGHVQRQSNGRKWIDLQLRESAGSPACAPGGAD